MEKKLQRNEQDKMLAGVCSGLADYFDVDVTWVRIAFVLVTFSGFPAFLAYIILWIAVPVRPYIPGTYNPGRSRYSADYRVYEDRGEPSASNTHHVPEPPVVVRKSGNGRMIAGLVLIAFGAFFMLDEFNFIPYWFDFDKLWPLVFIIPGILIITKNGRRTSADEGMNYSASDIPPSGTSASTTTTTTSTTDTAGTSSTVTGEEETKL